VIAQENYCGPISWITGLFLFPCICFCESANAGVMLEHKRCTWVVPGQRWRQPMGCCSVLVLPSYVLPELESDSGPQHVTCAKHKTVHQT
jgi:hypothetical protein